MNVVDFKPNKNADRVKQLLLETLEWMALEENAEYGDASIFVTIFKENSYRKDGEDGVDIWSRDFWAVDSYNELIGSLSKSQFFLLAE